MCKNIARKDIITARRKRLAKSEAAYAQRGIPHSKRLGRRSICGAVLMPMNMPLLELDCFAKAPNPEAQHATTLRGMAPNPEAQHATTLRGNVLEPCVRTANHIEEKDTCTVKKLLWRCCRQCAERTCAWKATACLAEPSNQAQAQKKNG